MSTITEKKLGQGQIASGSRTTLYTVPASTDAIVKTIIITNTTATAATISIWHVPNGGSYGDTNAIVKTLNIPANDFTQINTYLIMDTTGDTLQAEAGTASAITMSVYGAELV